MIQNDACCQLLLDPHLSIDHLTDKEEGLETVKSIFTDIEQVDFMVGCLADKEAQRVLHLVSFLTTSSLLWLPEGYSLINFPGGFE